MALATFKFLKCTGINVSRETDCDKQPNFLSADTTDANFQNWPIAVPEIDGNPNHSYELWIKVNCTGAPENYCQNFVIWGNSNQPDFPTNKLRIMIGTTATPSTPTMSSSNIAINPQINYYSAGTSTSWPLAQADNKIELVGEETEYLIMQLKVEDGAARGNMGGQSFSVQYEEV